MRWDDRQVAMLGKMGIRLWQLPQADPVPVSSDTPASSAVPPAVEVAALRPLVGTTPPLLQPALPIAALDWPALREAVASCTACRLCESRRQTVFGIGHARAEWMIVGEAPGEDEDELGEPFVGRSGRLLDNMLRAVGLTRGDADAAHQVYIANTVKCRPPGNRNPEPDELARCEPYLIRQLQLVQPRIILAMGRFVVQGLLRSTEPIGRLRGRIHEYQGLPLIATYHPSYLLRNPEDKAKAWEDLCLAAATAAATAAVAPG